MPKQLALILCTCFVLYLLRLDRRQSKRVSWVIWISTAWMLIASSRSVDQWLGISGGSRESGGFLDPIFQMGLLLMGVVVLSQRRLNLAKLRREHVWLIVLVSYMLLSVLWSDSVFIGFKRWVRELTAVVMALLILSEREPKEAVLSLLRRTVYSLIPFSVLFVKYFPESGVVFSRYTGEVQWIGVTLQKNALGQLCLISAFFLIWTLVRRWRGQQRAVGRYQTHSEFFLLVMTAWLLKGPSMWAASATAIASLSTGLVGFWALFLMKKRGLQLNGRTLAALIACIMVLGLITPFVGGATITDFTGVLGRDSTLTGRTEIWAGLIPDLMRQPVVGYGFSGFWTIERTRAHNIGEAHNGYLDVCLQLGVIGMLLVGAFFLSFSRKLHGVFQDDFEWGCLCYCCVLMIVVSSIADSSIDSFTRLIMATILFLSVTLRLKTDRAKTYTPQFAPVFDGSAGQPAGKGF